MCEIYLQKEDIYTGELILVNEQFPLRKRKKEERLIPADEKYPEILLGNKAASMLGSLLREIRAEQQIVPVSGYRSLEEQTSIYEDTMREHGETFTRQYVALPNHSEHQTGLAIDLGRAAEEIDFICPEFPYDGICGKFRDRAAAYGFIERYGKEKENVTGIGWEPWHFRYVGAPHAMLMCERGICLEEYIELVKQYPYGEHSLEVVCDGWKASVSYQQPDTDRTKVEVPEDTLYQVSGNNVDGFILTIWEEVRE